MTGPLAIPLRVGLLHFTSPPIVGGVEGIVGYQASALVTRGHQVEVLAGRGGAFRRDVTFRHLPALDSKYPPLLAVNDQLKRGHVPSEFSALVEQIESWLEPILDRLDVCIVHNALTLHFNLPLTAALDRIARSSRGCGLIAWCHDLSWVNPLYRDVVHDGFPWNLLRQPVPRTSYVVVSEDRGRDLARLTGLHAQDLTIIPAGVDLARKWALGPAARRLLAEYDLLQAEPFILLPVRITRRKNIEYAIHVVAELVRLGLRPRILVTGPRGPHDPSSIRYVRELEALVSELGVQREVVLLQAGRSPTGRRWKPSDAMMDQLYRAADLVLFPSSQEGFGIPVLEAGVVNLPLFCSDIPPFREIATSHAHYFRLEDPAREVAVRIADFLAADDRYVLRKRVAREFDWDSIVDKKLLPLLSSAADRRMSLAARP